MQSYKPGDKVHLKSMDFYTTIADIHEDVVLEDRVIEKAIATVQ